ncbi:MAG: sulfatase-like hydrolase/transferase [Verrucomicrobiae bacterium]|nr:sulfatase-like hydrolase/transferase [Verrucomicrobiae bacterium]
MKLIYTLLVSLLLAPLAAPHAAETKGRNPNVLLIIADDQGYGDFGFMGNRLVKTPSLDRLAGESAVFRNFVVAAACSPTRSAIWTGRDHLLTGVWGVPPKANLRDDEVRMPAFFKKAGYRTFHVGKLDCVKAGSGGPSDFGWENWTGGGGYEHRDPMIFQAGKNRRGQGWTVEIWTEEAMKFIRANRDAPWFASVAYIIPHMPWVCDEKYAAPFLAQGCSKDLAACYGSIAHMDACIGQLLDALRETGQEQRTIVAFLSDNGQAGPETRNGTADGFVRSVDWEKRNVARLRGHKATVWENGIRVPLLLRWPGSIPPGERKQFGCAEDVLPTLLDLAAIPDTTQKHLPFSGVSLRPALSDAAETFERPAALRMAIAGAGAPRGGLGGPGKRKFEDHHLALRGPRFKYHALPGGKAALFDLDADPGETTDVWAKFPDVAAKMAQECRKRWDEILASGRAFAPQPVASPAATKESKGVTLEEKFDGELSEDWFWGLGTWTAKGGVLRGYESGPRRHGPVKMRRFPLRDGIVECEFRLEGKAAFAGVIFNGSQERGHLVHVVMGKDQLRILAHPKKGESAELLKLPATLGTGEWHRVRIEFKGPTLTAMVNDKIITADNPCIAEEKLTFGLGGDSGDPEGERAGALEFRKLKIVASP